MPAPTPSPVAVARVARVSIIVSAPVSHQLRRGGSPHDMCGEPPPSPVLLQHASDSCPRIGDSRTDLGTELEQTKSGCLLFRLPSEPSPSGRPERSVT